MANEFDPWTLADAAISLVMNPLGAAGNLITEGDPFKQGREIRENVQGAFERMGGAPPEPGTTGGPIQSIAEEQAQVEANQARRSAIQAAKEKIEQKRREEQTTGLMGTQTGFQTGGAEAFKAQQALAGLLGPEAQQAAIAQLESSPQFQSMLAQGEQAILQNASATGGLRGGNVQAALAQFRPSLLSNIIQQQYQQLMAMSGLGATAGQGLIGSSVSREQSASDLQKFYDQLAAMQGSSAAAMRAGGKLAQLEDVRRQQQQEQANALGWGSLIAPVAGTLLGGLLAGPPGAMAGAQVGSTLQSVSGQSGGQQPQSGATGGYNPYASSAATSSAFNNAQGYQTGMA